ncbi:MAG: cobyrinate a,c-diamide synthase [Propionibacteriaceae bacterium]
MIAAPGSGHGKTTVATGLMGAFRLQGLEVAGFKIGPDYIDPGYHTLATGRPSRNLDPFLCAPEQLLPLFRHGMITPTPADLGVVEGVMGLFDGQLGGEGFASTAHVATLLDAPVILVVDVSHASRTVAALVHGLHTFDPDVRLAGVILNKAGSPRHATEVVSALEATGLPVLGVLPRDAEITAPSRHLGLVPAAERPEAAGSVEHLCAQVADHLDLSAVLALAHAASPITTPAWDPAAVVRPPDHAHPSERPVIAVAGGRAFTFGYPETEELLRAAGCEPVGFDPVRDEALPPGTAGLYLGGGFPEVHAGELGANVGLRNAVRAAIRAGLPTVAECAGLLYLCDHVDGAPMVGALPADAVMTPRLTLRYRTAVADHDHLLAVAGERVTGHEFHRTTTTPAASPRPAWLVDGDPAGFADANLHASYLHVHWAGHPRLAQRFADAVHAYAASAGSAEQGHDYDLDHHGDREVEAGLVDLAVNVRLPRPPGWLTEVITATATALGTYPQTDAARTAIAAAHHVSQDAVLPTAGAAEAFTLVARALRPGHAVVVHPQFTEPEAALRAAGVVAHRLLLDADDGFAFHPDQVDPGADLVMIGNPTNPTGTLHDADALRSLLRPSRVVVVDEAFMDAVPGAPETLITGELTGLLVLRSLTKTWGLAGLRAGYVVGDPPLIDRLRTQQPPWSVSTPALAATAACLTPDALAEVAVGADEISGRRATLVAGLGELGLPVAGDPHAPFVLVDTRRWAGRRSAGSVRSDLRQQGFAVRRGDTFPGLDADWVRIAVRDHDTIRGLLKALLVIRESS